MYSLVPSIRSNQKPHIKTSIYNIFVCGIFVIAFTILHLWVAVIMNILVGCLWGILTYQRLKSFKENDMETFNKKLEEGFDIDNTID